MLLKNIRFLAVFMLCLVFSSAYAVDRTIQTNQANHGRSGYDSYINQLINLKAQLEIKANEVGNVITCNESGQVYDGSPGSGCIATFAPENDPTKANHADVAIPSGNPGLCSGTNEVREFNGTIWACKPIERIIASVSGPTVYTYAWVSGGWSACFPATCGTQTRPVTCERNDGAVVASSFCGGIRPNSWQECNVPWNKRWCEPAICVNNGLDGNPVQMCP